MSVSTACFIDHLLLVQHLREVYYLQVVIDGSVVAYVTLRRSSGCQHVVPNPADSSQRGLRPPAGAICILDRTIHHHRSSAPFRVPLPTASGSNEQLYMYMPGNESLWNLPTGSGDEPEGLKGINESIPEAEPPHQPHQPPSSVVPSLDIFATCLIVSRATLNQHNKNQPEFNM